MIVFISETSVAACILASCAVLGFTKDLCNLDSNTKAQSHKQNKKYLPFQVASNPKNSLHRTLYLNVIKFLFTFYSFKELTDLHTVSFRNVVIIHFKWVATLLAIKNNTASL